MVSPQHSEKINVEVCLKRHHSTASFDSVDSRRPSKRSKLTIEVGVNGETPPRLTGFQDDVGEDDEGDSQELTPVIPMTTESSQYVSPAGSSRGSSRQRKVSGGESNSQTPPITGPTSFFGSHQPLPVEQPNPKVPPGLGGGKQDQNPLPVSVGKPAISSSTRGTLDSILSQLSDEKLFNDLASAVSKVTNKPPIGVQNTSFSGASSASASSGAKPVPDYGANTPPPPEDLEPAHSQLPSSERFPRVAGGPPFPQQGTTDARRERHAAISKAHPSRIGIGTGNQNKTGTPVQQSSPQEWNRDRERFANTPPPDYQPSFNFPQGAGAPNMANQQPSQAGQYHGSNSTYQQNQSVDPRSVYNNYPQNQDQFRGQQQYSQQQQGVWDYSRKHGGGGRGSSYESSHHSQGEEKNSKFSHEDSRGHERLPHGDRSRGRGNSYRRGNYGPLRRGRDFRHDKHYSPGVKEEHNYPSGWYRK